MRICDWSSDVCSSDLALGTLVPGLNISKPSFGAFVPAIRGISTRLNTAENPTAIYVDGVLIPDQREGFRDLFDIEQITVLKGPQGTLFGRNATAGRSEEHTSELQSLMRISYAVFCLKKQNSTL